jgi:hypothetical protein
MTFLLSTKPIATEGGLERTTHHRVAPLTRARRALPLRTFRFFLPALAVLPDQLARLAAAF